MERFPARCSLQPDAGAPAEEGPCTVELSADAVTVAPEGGSSLRLAFAELQRWTVADYAVTLELAGGGRVVLRALGRRLEPFCKALPAARVEHAAQALLLLERGAFAEEAGAYRWRGAPPGDEPEPCRLRLQRTSLVVFPREALPFRVGLGELRGMAFDEGAWAVVLALGDGRALELLRLGKRTDALRAGLARRADDLAARALRALSALAPDVPALALRRLGALLPDGVPASRAAIEAAAPGAWAAALAHAFASGERRAAAEHLAGRAEEAWLAVKETDPSAEGEVPEGAEEEGAEGATRPPELAGREVMVLFRVGRALALEVPSSTESATYVFGAGVDPGASVRAVVQALAAIQFRREPISLPEAQLLAGPGARYREALKLVPGLAAARAAFLGRAVHAGAEAWRRALDEALARA